MFEKLFGRRGDREPALPVVRNVTIGRSVRLDPLAWKRLGGDLKFRLDTDVLNIVAQGIVVFMVFGAGLTAGLLAQIGHAIDSASLHDIGRFFSWLLPFEGLYTAGLHALISDTSGLTGVVLQLGPFGASEAAGPGLILWAFAYMLGVLALAAFAFSRRDL